ncbi:MAG: VCBS repeat-containing protein [Nitrospirota bacterium]
MTHQDRVTVTGSKSSGSGIVINGFQQLPPNDQTFWALPVDLDSEGPNTLIVQAMDDLGNLSDTVMVTIQRDTLPPDPPTVSAPPSSMTNPVTITGTKEAGAFVRLNGRRITAASSDINWTYQATLTPPPPPQTATTLTLTAVDAAGNESAPESVSVTLTGACVAPSRPVFPLDGYAIPWGRAFSWTPQVGATGYVFELALSPAFDTFVVSPPPVVVDSRFEPTTASPPVGVYYWRVGTMDASCTSYGPTRKVIIGSTTGDVTGDGFADIFVGVSGDDRADLEAGAAYLYQGGAVRDVLVDAVMTGQGQYQAFGTAVAKAGDIDYDGYVDLLVGAYNADRDADADDNSGTAYLYWGGPTPATTPGLVFRGEAAGGSFGVAVAGIGDVNGDGYPDIAVGAYHAPVTATCGGGTATLSKVGSVYVFLGGPRNAMDALPDFVLAGETAADPDDPTSACRGGDEFGLAVAGPGDINGDGYDDLAVGARYYDDLSAGPAGQDIGRVYVFFGGPWFAGVDAARADVVLTGLSAGDEFGATVAGAGDTDGDGLADLLIGAPLQDGVGIDAGSVSWFFGRGDGVSPTPVEIGGASAEDLFGSALASAGDINGDGLADVVIGAFRAGPTDNGSASYFLGNTGRIAGSPITIVGESTPNDGDHFGVSVSGAGDVDGDGFDDTVVGAWQHDVCFDPLNEFCDDAGRAYVILGPHTTTRSAAGDPTDWLLSGFNLRDGLGVSVD